MPDEEKPFIDTTLVEPIVLDDAHGRWQFEPKADITPLEAALISQLFVAMVLRRKRLDWREYLTRDWGRNLRFEPYVIGGPKMNDLKAHVDAKVEPWRHFKELDA